MPLKYDIHIRLLDNEEKAMLKNLTLGLAGVAAAGMISLVAGCASTNDASASMAVVGEPAECCAEKDAPASPAVVSDKDCCAEGQAKKAAGASQCTEGQSKPAADPAHCTTGG
jgi:hypothetical protein